ncbi:uncharacterized protein LOC114472608 isoform X1 [Gouania willdenowi]|uniref:uncharacterized protein LOC114472608 isoform X1 n=1 Tax=Gouania willdenowi TaxID=441366 RepID=UPI0010541368|nr:uncharacterized protein LOC114472608 isoform X1 [Gouania willdenowi]
MFIINTRCVTAGSLTSLPAAILTQTESLTSSSAAILTQALVESVVPGRRFPKTKERRRKWELALRRKDFSANNRTMICSEHFRREEFDRTGQTVRLKEGVVPSIFNFPAHLQRMPRHCSVGGCSSRDNRETREAGITFHRLPKGATRRHLWISNARRPKSWDPKTDFVYFCSKHFTPQSFELTGCSGVRRLKEEAVPTMFEISTGAKHRTSARQKGVESSVRRRSRRIQSRDGSSSSSAVKCEPPPKEDTSPSNECDQVPEPASSPGPRPLSPSRYMRRLPPPAGFHLAKEHSYALLSPGLWRRRYDHVVDSLENVLRQLHAARRRESRLRRSLMLLRDQHAKGQAPPPHKHKGRAPRGGAGLHSQSSEGSCSHCGGGRTLTPPNRGRSHQVQRSANTWTCGRTQVQIVKLTDGGLGEEGGTMEQVLLIPESMLEELLLEPESLCGVHHVNSTELETSGPQNQNQRSREGRDTDETSGRLSAAAQHTLH